MSEKSARPDMVLVVDDDPLDLHLAQIYMREYRCVVKTCSSFREGLEKVTTEWYDYAFIDLWLDGRKTAIYFINSASPKNDRISWYVFSDGWLGSTGSRLLTETMKIGATPIVKGSIDLDGLQLKKFQQVLALILTPK